MSFFIFLNGFEGKGRVNCTYSRLGFWRGARSFYSRLLSFSSFLCL